MILHKHILRTHIGPFLFSFFTLTFVFLLQFLIKQLDQLVGKGLGVWVIIQLVSLSLAWIVVLAVPMSVLVATLMAFGSLSSHGEITAMKASGVSLYRMMAPLMASAVVLAVLLVQFNNDVLQDANHKVASLLRDIHRKKPTLTLEPGVFSQDIQGYSILVRRTFEASNDLEGVTIFDYSNPNLSVVITAQRGTISFSQDYRKLIMDLWDGEIHRMELADPNSYRLSEFEKHRLTMNAEGFEFERSPDNAFARGDRELSAHAMRTRVDSLLRQNEEARQRIEAVRLNFFQQNFADSIHAIPPLMPSAPFLTAQAYAGAMRRGESIRTMLNVEESRISSNSRQINSYMVEVHKKYAIPASCLVFVLVGVPLGIMARRGGFGVAASLSFGFFLVYWASLIGGEKLADRGFISPFVGMWFANILIGSLGLYLTIRMKRESMVIPWSKFTRWVPRHWRAPEPMEPLGGHER